MRLVRLCARLFDAVWLTRACIGRRGQFWAQEQYVSGVFVLFASQFFARYVRLDPFAPVARLPPMMRDGEYLDGTFNLAVDDIEMKNLEHGAPDVGCCDDAITVGRRADL